MIDDRTPVMVGAAQWCGDRHPDPSKLASPIGVLEDVARRAAEDAGAPDLLRDLDAVLVTALHAWGDTDPVTTLANRLGASPRKVVLTDTGGETGIRASNWAAERILAGELDSALVAGCNFRAHTQGEDADLLPGPKPAGLDPKPPMWSGPEGEHGLVWPHLVYAMFESAHRAMLGRTIEEHQAALGALMQPFTEVAAANPYSWFPTAHSAEELVTVTPENRMVTTPYPKYLNAVRTDQGAAVLVLSAGKARALGIPEERWAYWWGGGHDEERKHEQAAGDLTDLGRRRAEQEERGWFWTIRPDLTTCPAMHRSHHGALAMAGMDVDEVDVFDFYSCFPAAVEMACHVLDMDPMGGRPLTLTGGLPYFGGPGSAYPIHSQAVALDHLREHRDQVAMLTGNGWFFSRHAAGVWAGVPRPDRPVRTAPPAPDDTPLPVADRPEGPGSIEAYTVEYDREGAPERGVAVGRLDDGDRFVTLLAPDELDTYVAREGVGRRGIVHPGQPTNTFTAT